MRARDARRPIGIIIVSIVLVLIWCTGAVAAEPKIVLLRGWFGVFSTGLDAIADELKAKGIRAQVAGHLAWKTAIADIVREKAAGKIGPVILVGHSQGANNVIDMARALADRNIQVELLITLVPLLQSPVPANVVRAVDFYQSPGWGAPLTGGPGFHGKLANIDVSDDPTIMHVSIDKSTRVQAEIMREILAVVRTGESVSGARNPPADRAAERKPAEPAGQASKAEAQ
jgi:hypothetical protein